MEGNSPGKFSGGRGDLTGENLPGGDSPGEFSGYLQKCTLIKFNYVNDWVFFSARKTVRKENIAEYNNTNMVH